MAGFNLSLRRLAVLGGYALGGAGATAATATVLLAVGQPVQLPIYEVFVRRLGPWSATTVASILSFALVSLLAVAIPTVLAAWYAGDRDRLRPLLAGAGGLLGLVAGLLVGLAFAGRLGLPTVLVLFGTLLPAVAVALHLADVGAEPLAAFLGGLPVLALLLLLLGFGLGWGGGYDLVAEPVDPTREPTADFAAIPEVRDDLFAPGNCDEEGCRLSLRGYDREAAAARFLYRHGARCPFLNAPPGRDRPDPGSFVATHDGQPYRVACVAYGD